jgi:small-conductance mechanosensitive channel
MNNLENFFEKLTDNVGWSKYLELPIVRFAALLVLFAFIAIAVHRIVMSLLFRFTSRSQVAWLKGWVPHLKNPLRVGLFAVAVSFAIESSSYNFSDLKVVQGILKTLVILAIFWSIERLLLVLLQNGVLLSSITPGARSFLGGLSRVFVILLAGLMVLDSAGVSITPLLASLGVGSLAVALALQDTLSNFFSGIYILADKPFRIGDFVQLESGEKGYVEKIGWRSTHLRMLSNNAIVIPNAKIASSVLTNYDLVEQQTTLIIPVGVAYGTDLVKAEKVAYEVANKIITSVEGAVATVEPRIRFTEFADSSINFNIAISVKRFEDNYLVKHEMIKALHQRFNSEGIEIPFPQRVVHMTGGSK